MTLPVVKSLLFGRTFRLVVTVVFVLVVAIGSAVAAGVIGIPSLESIDNEFGDVDEEQTEILTEMSVDNPNPIGVASADVDATYVVSVNDVEMADGGGTGIALEPGLATESFRTQMQNDRIPEWWVTHIENDERTTVDIDATVSSGALDRSTEISEQETVETDLMAEFNSDETRPVDADHVLVDDPFLYVNRTEGEWGDVDDDHTEIDLRFDIYNPQVYTVPMTQLGYDISMNQVAIGEGESDREHVLPPGETTTVETTTRIQNDNLDVWWPTHIENDEVSELVIEFSGEFEVVDGTVIQVPLEGLDYEDTIETDIWGNEDQDRDQGQGESAGDDGSEDDGTSDGTDDGDDTSNEAGDDESDDGALPLDL